MKLDNIIFTKPEFIEKPSAWMEHIPFAFFVTDMLKPKVFVELGTHHGNSYFAFCQGFAKAKANIRAFAIDHWQGDVQAGMYDESVFEYVNKINAQHFSAFSQLLRMPFDEAVDRFEDGSIDLLHIDGMHGYEAVKHDFETWLPKMSERGVVLFHDTQEHKEGFGVWRLMDEIKNNYPLFNFKHGHGLGIVCTGSKVNEHFFQFIEDANSDTFILQLFENLGKKIDLGEQNGQLVKEQKNFNSTIEELENKLNQQKQIISNKNADNAKLFGDINKLELENTQLRQELSQLSTSWSWRITKPLRSLNFHTLMRLRMIHHMQRIEKCELFDADYYLQNYPDVGKSSLNPVKHYLLFGGFEGRKPSPDFDSAFYLMQYPDVQQSGTNPLLHYVLHGKDELRDCSAKDSENLHREKEGQDQIAVSENDIQMIKSSGLFDENYYLSKYPDIKQSRQDALLHFLRYGGFEGRKPHSDFDTNYYKALYPDVKASAINPLLHYLLIGKSQNRQFSLTKAKIKIAHRKHKISGFSKQLLVCVPVYISNSNSFQLFTELIKSLKDSYPSKINELSFIFIDDSSTYPGIIAYYAEESFFNRVDVKVYFNKKNIGFSATVNKGIGRYRANRDVVILNCDTQIFEQTFEILQDVAYRQENIASVTPVSNKATIASISNFPFGEDNILDYKPKEIAKAIRDLRLSTDMYPFPTGHGFCMYLRSTAISSVGKFDEKSFGRGYCEENDWCQRAVQKGLINSITPEVYVFHNETSSFTISEMNELIKKNMPILNTKHPGYEREMVLFGTTDPLQIQRELISIKLSEIVKNRQHLSTTGIIMNKNPFPDKQATITNMNDLIKEEKYLPEKNEAFLFYPCTVDSERKIIVQYLNDDSKYNFIKTFDLVHFKNLSEYFSERLDQLFICSVDSWGKHELSWLNQVKEKVKTISL